MEWIRRVLQRPFQAKTTQGACSRTANRVCETNFSLGVAKNSSVTPLTQQLANLTCCEVVGTVRRTRQTSSSVGQLPPHGLHYFLCMHTGLYFVCFVFGGLSCGALL